MSEEDAVPEEMPEEAEGGDGAEAPDAAADASPEAPLEGAEGEDETPETPTKPPPKSLGPLATSTPRSIKIHFQHEAGLLKHITLEDDQLGQAELDFSEISANATRGSGFTQSLSSPDDLLQLSVTNTSKDNGNGKNGASCSEEALPKFSRQPKKPPSDEETSIMFQSALETSLKHNCKSASVNMQPPLISSTPMTPQAIANEFSRSADRSQIQASSRPGMTSGHLQQSQSFGPPQGGQQYFGQQFPQSGSPCAPPAQQSRSPCAQSTLQVGSPCGPQAGYQSGSPCSPGNQSGSPCAPSYQSGRGCGGGQLSQQSPQLPQYGRGCADSSVYMQSSLQNYGAQDYSMPGYQEPGNDSSWMSPAPQKGMCPNHGSRMNRSMPLGPVSSGRPCPEKPRCGQPMSQSDNALQQIETSNNRLMNLGRQVVDMRAELQPAGGCNEKPPCGGDNRTPTVADALANNRNIVCDLERKIAQLQNEMKAMLCSTTQSNQFQSVSTSQQQKQSGPKKTCCMRCKCKKPHPGSPCKT